MKINRTFLVHISFLLIIVSVQTSLFAQFADNKLPDNFRFIEELLISTDRDIYITGEEVWFKVYETDRMTRTFSDLSKIIYLELLDESNDPVIQLKIRADGNSGSGRFILPDTLVSGNYIVRAYTSWMLNYSDAWFSYKTISVVNPYKNYDRLIRPGSKPEIVNSNSSAGDLIFTEINKTKQDKSKYKINVDCDKADYLCRNKVRVLVSISDVSDNPVKADLSLSVIKSSLVVDGRMHLKNTHLRDSTIGFLREDSIRLPELEGEIISGTIRSKLTYEPMADTDISISIVGKSARCQFGKTNSRGEFMFIFNRLYGLNDIVIQPLIHDEAGCYVEFNLQFCNSFIDNSQDLFYLDSITAEQISRSIISMQVNKLYSSESQKKSPGQTNIEFPDFYGKPNRRVLLSDYIELTNISEVVKEILPEVKVYRKNNKAWFRITTSNPTQKFENQALVVVDGVPVYNIENLLNVPSKEMERIDVINLKYYYSDYVFDGIISFITKKGNLSDFEFDDSAFRQVYEGCQQPQVFYSPVYATDSLKNSHIPDFRNTLYWVPDLKTDASGKTFAEFYTSDEPGEYLVIIEGITSSGESLYGRNTLIVN